MSAARSIYLETVLVGHGLGHSLVDHGLDRLVGGWQRLATRTTKSLLDERVERVLGSTNTSLDDAPICFSDCCAPETSINAALLAFCHQLTQCLQLLSLSEQLQISSLEERGSRVVKLDHRLWDDVAGAGDAAGLLDDKSWQQVVGKSRPHVEGTVA